MSLPNCIQTLKYLANVFNISPVPDDVTNQAFVQNLLCVIRSYVMKMENVKQSSLNVQDKFHSSVKVIADCLSIQAPVLNADTNPDQLLRFFHDISHGLRDLLARSQQPTIDNAQLVISSYKTELEKIKVEKDQLLSQLHTMNLQKWMTDSNKDATHMSINIELIQCRKRLENLTRILTEKQNRVAQLESAVCDKTALLENHSLAVQKMESELNQEKETLQLQLEATSQSSNSKEHTIESLRNEISELNSRLIRQQEHTKEWQAKHNMMKSSCDELQEKLDSKSKEISTLENDLQKVDAVAAKEVELVQTEKEMHEETRSKMQTFSHQIYALQNELSSVKAESQRKESLLKSEVDSLKESITNERNSRSQFLQEIEDLKASDARVHSELHSRNMEISKYRKELKAFSERECASRKNTDDLLQVMQNIGSAFSVDFNPKEHGTFIDTMKNIISERETAHRKEMNALRSEMSSYIQKINVLQVTLEKEDRVEATIIDSLTEEFLAKFNE